MKKWNLRASFVQRGLLFFTLVMFNSISGLAQACPYPVTNTYNTTGCDVTFDYTIMDCNTPPSVCFGPTSITVSAGTTYSITCPTNCTGGICNIIITVTSIGGVSVTPTSVDMNIPTSGLSCPPCCGSMVNYTFNWGTTGTTFN